MPISASSLMTKIHQPTGAAAALLDEQSDIRAQVAVMAKLTDLHSRDAALSKLTGLHSREAALSQQITHEQTKEENEVRELQLLCHAH